ncbi:Protein of unknown function [Sphingobacterium nematocida]|uniref:DUF3995 domain-containing protein n=1 Tax=Sphingobacterium nematocida TaxID=1513896 RepID=A0A1T5GQE5_9SPHI|nr:DUF3995 domain-containing protein [Sphingobacterium nematocida]SKC10550.1 Protein of unknown function [Sphingobacterium nematocida]
MTTIIALILTIVFFTLSGIHIYWSFGGKWANNSVVPSNDDDIKVIMPGFIPTFTVAIGLLIFGGIVLLNIIELANQPSVLYVIRKYGLWFIIGIFTLRAIGDFKYMGFFKKVKQTKFGKNDTKYYSPLCLTIGILALLLAAP